MSGDTGTGERVGAHRRQFGRSLINTARTGRQRRRAAEYSGIMPARPLRDRVMDIKNSGSRVARDLADYRERRSVYDADRRRTQTEAQGSQKRSPSRGYRV
jgi:hypothetical protein